MAIFAYYIMELTANLRKLVQSLSSARHRREHGMFVAEGTKCVLETIGAFRCCYLFATAEWLDKFSDAVDPETVVAVKSADIERMSQLKTPQPVIAVYEIPSVGELPSSLDGELSIALDHVQDPGNLGTIIRIADWFGIKSILASADTVDCFNPKVVQATMGAIGRVKIYYVDLPETLADLRRSGVEVYGTFLDGENIYSTRLSSSGVIVMGNEGNGIGCDVAATVDRRLFIPPYPAGVESVESLNVSMATAITVAEFRRRQTVGK